MALSLCPGWSAAEDLVARGRRIYESGMSTDGQPVQAQGAGGSRLQGEAAACTGCHRRSGMGSREGRVIVPPVTGAILYAQPQQVWPQRPGRPAQTVVPLRMMARDAYDDARLARAIGAGIDSSGVPLDELMPRYALSAADMQGLLAYLKLRWSAPVPGLSGQGIRLATIITPDADPARASGVAVALTAWSRSGALGGMPIDLQIWRLAGAPDTWGAQLRAWQLSKPVFAVLSGAGGANWAPVRDFCEQAALPCLFPMVDMAPEDDQDFYSMYLSRGVWLEARILARQIREQPTPAARVLQWVDNEAGERAAQLLTQELAPAHALVRRWDEQAAAAMLTELRPSDVLVSWLNAEHLSQLARAQPDGPGVRQATFSAQLAPPLKTALPQGWRQDARWISLRSDPQRVRGQGVLGLTPWLARLPGLPGDETWLSELYAATYFFGDALSRMRGRWSAEYLLETLETSHFSRPAGAAYYALSLAAGQREAAKSGHLIGFTGPTLQELLPLSPRLSP